MTLSFVVLEASQFVFFGGLFQRMSSFTFGFLVFGLTVLIFVGWSLLFYPEQVRAAFKQPKQLLAINLGAVVTFTAYLLSVQLVEPAVTYTISSGAMPITAYVLYRLGVREGEPMRNRPELVGNLLILVGIIFLAVITIAGWSGFVRGDWLIACAGVGLAIVDGVFFTLIIVYSQRLSNSGVGPGAVLGLRLPLYVLVTGLFVLSDSNQSHFLSASDTALFVVIGFLLTIPPLYLLQKAVLLLPTLTLSALTALGPVVIFMLQIFEGRVEYKAATLIGLSVYIAGAILSSVGAVKGSAQTEFA